MEKHVAAFLLKKNGASNTEISEILKIGKNTPTTWAEKYNWEEKIMDEQLFQESSLEVVRRLISHNLKVLDAIKDRMLDQHDIETATVEELKKMLTDKGDVDALNKLYVNIRGKEMTWEQVVKNIRHFMEYLESEKFSLAQQVVPYSQAFLDTKRKSSQA